MRISNVRGNGLGSNHQFYFTLRCLINQNQRFVEMAGNPVPDGMFLPIVPDEPGQRVVFQNSNQRLQFGTIEYVLKNGEKLMNRPFENASGSMVKEGDYRNRSFIHSNPVNQSSSYGLPTDRAKAVDQYFVHVLDGSGNSLNPDFDPNTNRAYLGTAISANNGQYAGQTQVVTTELPPVAITSLASLMHFKLSPGIVNFSSRNHSWDVSPNQMLGIGNSFAHPLIPSNSVYQDVPDLSDNANGDEFRKARDVFDQAFFVNDALWDEWFCSGISHQQQGVFKTNRNLDELVDDFVNGQEPLPNSKLQLWTRMLTPAQIKSELSNGDAPADEAWKLASSHLMLAGAFNINSTSVNAWKALFWGLQDRTIQYLDPNTGQLEKSQFADPKVVISRFTLPASSEEGSDAGDRDSWLGVRLLTAAQIDRLAEECVRQVKLRGPFLNLSDFINRRVQSGELGVNGALQAAIDWDEFNNNSPNHAADDSINARFKNAGKDDMITAEDIAYSQALPNPQAATGSRWTGIPGYLTQADILKRIGNQITPRDDTFRIRAYGEAVGANGNVIARAWCEAIVQRVPAYLDASDSPHTVAADLTSEINKNFGRRFEVTSFRWLKPEEI